MTEHEPNLLHDELTRIRALLEQTRETTDPLEAVRLLGEARRALDAVSEEAMARAVLEGRSVRQVGDAAGIAPNSVPPRLARSTTLGGYTSGQTITGPDIDQARLDAAISRSQGLRFQPRRRTDQEDQPHD